MLQFVAGICWDMTDSFINYGLISFSESQFPANEFIDWYKMSVVDRPHRASVGGTHLGSDDDSDE